MIFVLFYDPTFGLAIEDAFEEQGVPYLIKKTPESLLDVDPFFCKTMISAKINKETLQS